MITTSLHVLLSFTQRDRRLLEHASPTGCLYRANLSRPATTPTQPPTLEADCTLLSLDTFEDN